MKILHNKKPARLVDFFYTFVFVSLFLSKHQLISLCSIHLNLMLFDGLSATFDISFVCWFFRKQKIIDTHWEEHQSSMLEERK